MPIKKSAKKALRQAKTRTRANTARKKAFKNALKGAKKALSPETLSLAYQKLDKAAKAGTIHRNKAARLKSRLARQLMAKSKSAAA
jgi:small subunit ribosomal protein S20